MQHSPVWALHDCHRTLRHGYSIVTSVDRSSLIVDTPHLGRQCRSNEGSHISMRSTSLTKPTASLTTPFVHDRNRNARESVYSCGSRYHQRQDQVRRGLGLGPHKVAVRAVAHLRTSPLLSLPSRSQADPPKPARAGSRSRCCRTSGHPPEQGRPRALGLARRPSVNAPSSG